MGYDGVVVVGTKLDTKDFEAEINYVERKLDDMIADYQSLSKEKGFNEQSNQAIELRRNIQKVSNQLNDLKEKQKKINQGGLPNLKEIMEDIGKSTNKTIKSIGKWALGIFAIESAYGFVRRSMSTISQYNEQIAQDVQYISYAMASALQPLIESMINLAYKLLNYVNYIAQAWFGVNLFAKASADSMNKGAKSAEKMKKSLAGFDEMNVINDNGSVGALGGMPSMDLSEIQGEVPSWIKWIAENKDIVIAGLLGIAGAIASFKLIKLIQDSEKLLKLLPMFKDASAGIISLGIGVLIAGIVMLIQDIIDMISDPSWENFVAILGDIAIVIGGIMLVMGNWWGLLVAGIGLIVKLVAENWDTIKGILGSIGQWIYDNVLVPIGAFVVATIDLIVSIIKTAISIIAGIFTTVYNLIANPFITAKETIVGVFNGILTTIRGIFDVISGIFTGDWKRVMNGFKNIFKGVFDTLWSIAKAPLNLIIGGINALIRGMNKISFDVPEWVPGIGGATWGFKIKEIPKLAVGGIVNMPGRGVPVGGAIAGETRPEGVIPLTDSQAMETLGATIGKYITINANITNTMNGRVISREIQKIKANNDFATNS